MKHVVALYLLFNILFVSMPIQVLHKHDHKEVCELTKSNIDVSQLTFVEKIISLPQHFHEKEYDCEFCKIFSQQKSVYFNTSTTNKELKIISYFYRSIDLSIFIELFVYTISNRGPPLK